ncbi:uncharacterized protein LOC123354851 isoform X2 [Mauremys mutica]|uniref:uncharacterized protein LOC123354851 isoform X2 n=1 Tax=Mauremys mutica TaxID=74926 RepID=UPI001D16ACBB|nr:uncharacterized protein LOC123354851 isoform X2 [Mauremys mutica]
MWPEGGAPAEPPRERGREREGARGMAEQGRTEEGEGGGLHPRLDHLPRSLQVSPWTAGEPDGQQHREEPSKVPDHLHRLEFSAWRLAVKPPCSPPLMAWGSPAPEYAEFWELGLCQQDWVQLIREHPQSQGTGHDQLCRWIQKRNGGNDRGSQYGCEGNSLPRRWSTGHGAGEPPRCLTPRCLGPRAHGESQKTTATPTGWTLGT